MRPRRGECVCPRSCGPCSPKVVPATRCRWSPMVWRCWTVASLRRRIVDVGRCRVVGFSPRSDVPHAGPSGCLNATMQDQILSALRTSGPATAWRGARIFTSEGALRDSVVNSMSVTVVAFRSVRGPCESKEVDHEAIADFLRRVGRRDPDARACRTGAIVDGTYCCHAVAGSRRLGVAEGHGEIRTGAESAVDEGGRGYEPRTLSPRLGVADALPLAGLVRQREVRHLHPLGRVLGAGVRQRMVFAPHVSAGQPGIQASPCHLWPAIEVRLQGLHPDV